MKFKAKWFIFWRNLRSYGLIHRCHDCGQADHILGIPVGDHWDCMPF